MPFHIQRSNILAFSGDAIINPTDAFLSGSGSLDAQIHKMAGMHFRLECAKRKALGVGEAVITHGGHLTCRYVIHTSAPFWTGEALEEEQLRSCYRNSLALAAQFGLEELAFPLIGSGTKGFPKELVLQVAAEEISAFLATHEDTYILLVIHDKGMFQPDPALLLGLESFIRDAERQERREQLYASMLEDASTVAFSAIHPYVKYVIGSNAAINLNNRSVFYADLDGDGQLEAVCSILTGLTTNYDLQLTVILSEQEGTVYAYGLINTAATDVDDNGTLYHYYLDRLINCSEEYAFRIAFCRADSCFIRVPIESYTGRRS